MEEVLLLMLVYCWVIALFFYVMLCGEASRFAFVRAIHRGITGGICRTVVSVRRKVLGERANDAMGRCEHYMCRSSNPILAILYLVLLWGGVVIFFLYVMPLLPNRYVSELHLLMIPIAILLPNLFFLLAMKSDPGIVNKDTVARFEGVFPYDGIVFFPKKCTTCDVIRPARTKHCGLCGRCVSRFDHHCAWVNNCIGEYNIKFFLGFLFTTASLCFYGASLCATVVVWIVDETQLFTKFVRGEDGEPIAVGWEIAFRYLMAYHAPIMGVGLFMGIIALVLYAFFGYHCYLVARNTTTSEGFKWADALSALSFFRWRQDQVREAGTAPSTAAVSTDAALKQAGGRVRARGKGEGGGAETSKRASGLCLGEILADGELQLSDAEVLTLDLPSVLHNPYNRGALANFGEVFWPPSRRRVRPTYRDVTNAPVDVPALGAAAAAAGGAASGAASGAGAGKAHKKRR